VLKRRRTDRGWSRALLARRARVDQHTVGRIEAGTVWPDLATVERLANAMNLELALVTKGSTPAGGRPARAPEPEQPLPPGPIPTRSQPAAARVHTESLSESQPLSVGLGADAEPTAAAVIEAILANSPRTAHEVERLRGERRRSSR
jgi:transcriptional regulator with XRE-family HTH domain